MRRGDRRIRIVEGMARASEVGWTMFKARVAKPPVSQAAAINITHAHLEYIASLINCTELERFIEKLHLPDDVIKSCNEEDTIPKIIDSEEALLIQIQCLLTTEIKNNEEVNFGNLIIYLTHHFCFTAASEPIPALSEFIESCNKALRYAKTPNSVTPTGSPL